MLQILQCELENIDKQLGIISGVLTLPAFSRSVEVEFLINLPKIF